MIIALDMDGVMCEEPQNEHIVRLNAEFDTKYTLEDITDFEYSMLTHQQRQFLFGLDCWHREDLYDKVPMSAEKLEIIKKLRELGRVIALSSPLEGHIKSKYRWLRKSFDRKDIFLASDKTLVKADVLVDDCLDNIFTWPGEYAIIYDQPWNRNQDGVAFYPRAHTFYDVYDIIKHHRGL